MAATSSRPNDLAYAAVDERIGQAGDLASDDGAAAVLCRGIPITFAQSIARLDPSNVQDGEAMFESVSNNVSFRSWKRESWNSGNARESTNSRSSGDAAPRFVFYEGPPTANGMPHPGHCLTRAIKDLFPRYRTMRGYFCERKAGWDTHGLPVEVEVCKELGIHAKEEIEVVRRRAVHSSLPGKRLALHEGMGTADRAARLLDPPGRSVRDVPPELRRERLVVAEEPVRSWSAVPGTQDRLVVGPRGNRSEFRAKSVKATAKWPIRAST